MHLLCVPKRMVIEGWLALVDVQVKDDSMVAGFLVADPSMVADPSI